MPWQGATGGMLTDSIAGMSPAAPPLPWQAMPAAVAAVALPQLA